MPNVQNCRISALFLHYFAKYHAFARVKTAKFYDKSATFSAYSGKGGGAIRKGKGHTFGFWVVAYWKFHVKCWAYLELMQWKPDVL